MTQVEKAQSLRALHQKGTPVVIYNIWDAGGAKTLEDAGAKAVATGSAPVAMAHGYADGEQIPLEFVLQIVERIASTVSLPVSVDFEGGYAREPEGITANVVKVIKAGAVGVNFEDRIVAGGGLYSVEEQAKRVKAVRAAGDQTGVPLVINARTDLFLGTDEATHEGSVAEAIERGKAYAAAGADCFFVPGLKNLDLIKQIVDAVSLPVNVIMLPPLSSVAEIAALGVGRVSYGPMAYKAAMADFAARFEALG